MSTAKPTPDLGQIQRWIQATIAHPAGVAEGVDSPEARQHIDVSRGGVEKVLTRSRALTALERLAVYGSAYYARLLDCLREEFPVLKHALGEEVFDAFAVGYLQSYPSRTYTLLELGTDFPRFLRETRPATDGGGTPADWADFLIDLATLELTFNQVFDGPGVEGQHLLDAEQLKAVPEEVLLEARLVPVSCLRLLTLRYPVHAYLSAVRRNDDPSLPEPTVTFLAVTRRRYVVRHYELSPPAHRLLTELVAGEPLGRAILRAVEVSSGTALDRMEAHLRAWFDDWAAEGFFLKIKLPDSAQPL